MTAGYYPSAPGPDFWRERTAVAQSSGGGDIVNSDLLIEFIDGHKNQDGYVPVAVYLDLLSRLAVSATVNGRQHVALSADHLGVIATIAEGSTPDMAPAQSFGELADVISMPPFDEPDAA